jgi:hypothetical protein
VQVRAPESRIPLSLALVGFGAPLGVLAFGGLFSRYAADDYCTAGQVQMAGLLETQSRLYVAWSGRFATTLLVTLVESIGTLAVPFLPGLALVAWLAAATWAAREMLIALGWRIGLAASAVLASLVVFATLQMTADLPQVLYWQTGMFTYLWPLVLATVYVGWVAHGARSPAVPWPAALGVSFGLAFLAGGSSETFAAAQVTALTLASGVASAASTRRGRSRPLVMLAVALLGALLAFGIVALAPGNSARQETVERTPLSLAVPQALEFTLGWLRLTFARPHAAVLLLLVGIAFALGAAAEATTRAHATSAAPGQFGRVASVSATSIWIGAAVGLLAVALVVVLACMLPAFYALSSNPPGRAQVIPQYVLVCSVAAAAWLLGSATASRFRLVLQSPVPGWVALGGLVVLLGLGPLLSTRDALQQIAPAAAYAAAWDQLDAEVRAERHQGVQDVTVRPLPSSGLVHNLDFIGPNRHDWLNECVARYYDLTTIASTLSVP